MSGLLDLPPILGVRKSFRWKILLTLLGSVALIAFITIVVVRRETAMQIERAAREAESRAAEAFIRLEQRNAEQLSQLANVFTGSRQAVAALEAAIESGDFETLKQDIAYELELRLIPSDRIVAFTDDDAEPVLAMRAGEPIPGEDPAGVRAAAEKVLFDGEDVVRGYRVIERRLYSVETVYLELGRPVGTVTLGVPLAETEMDLLGNVIGGEVCFVVDRLCVAGTARGQADVDSVMVRVVGSAQSEVAEISGERWSLLAGSLSADDDTAWWVIGLPLSAIEQPFQRVERAVLITAVIAILLASLLSSVLSRSLTRPVNALVEATGRVEEGDFGTRVEVTSIDEIGTLARAFNDMTHGLALKEQYRGVLDKVVSKDIAEELLKGEVKLGGENREVSVLFADITGFTTITDGMSPPDVIALLNECMERLTDVVEREGGVVDKYVGDQIMALFGAPVTRGSDALRAVRAAMGMQRAMAELNEERAGRGELPLEVSIGINTGVAMAGNMGSPSRLNYTVLGDAVNLASRVEHHAPSAGVLITQHTYAHVAQHVRVQDVGLVELRGFAQAVQLYQVVEVHGAPEPEGRRSGASGAALAPGAVALALLALGSGGLHAQLVDELPTLERLYLSSASGALQLGFSGRLDLEAYLPEDEPAWIIPSTEPFVAPRLRLFADAFLGERVFASAELRVDRGEEPAAGDVEVRIEQAFLRLTPMPELSLQAGKFVSPFAGYAQRHHTEADPLIRPPLTYDHRTILNAGQVPGSGSALLAWKDAPAEHRPAGSPVVWGTPYQWGAMVSGGVGRVSTRFALMNSVPSSAPEEWALDEGFTSPALVATVGAQLGPALRVEVSHSRGAWIHDDVGGLPPLSSAEDFEQRIWAAEAVFALGRTKLRGEVFRDSWEVPNVFDDAVDVSWYVEGEQGVAPGLAVAARYGRIHFMQLDPGPTGQSYGSGDAARWDYGVSRLQLGAGYHIARNAGVRAEATLNGSVAPESPRNDLFALQLWWEF
jgi:class 3 adenylate cyclase